MQFDLKKFFATGKQPYHAEFQCDLSGRDFAGAQIHSRLLCILMRRSMAVRYG